MAMYCRRFELRNCGRFLHVSSDFGSKYKTHVFLTSEALYAGMTREISREGKTVDAKTDKYDFLSTYDTSKVPIWFSPGMFVDKSGKILSKTNQTTDVNTFNVLDEDYPGTGAGKKRKSSPTYGTMETLLPNNIMLTYGLSKDRRLLEAYGPKSTYIMGKKRTMFQIEGLSPVIPCEIQNSGHVVPVQIGPDDVRGFSEYTVHTITMRYMLVSGFCIQGVYGCNFGEKMPAFAYPVSAIPQDIKGA